MRGRETDGQGREYLTRSASGTKLGRSCAARDGFPEAWLSQCSFQASCDSCVVRMPPSRGSLKRGVYSSSTCYRRFSNPPQTTGRDVFCDHR